MTDKTALRDNTRTALMALKHKLFGDERDADQVCQLFTSWEDRSDGYESLCGAICAMMANSGIDVESTLEALAVYLAGE